MNAQRGAARQSIRLAEDEALAVDLCPCGTMALHIGALSLRLHPDAISSLIEVLGQAVARRQMLVARSCACAEEGSDASPEPSPAGWLGNPADDRRGKA